MIKLNEEGNFNHGVFKERYIPLMVSSKYGFISFSRKVGISFRQGT
ncbi:hypothetical protein acsn021_33930 [Anaerocolumna cellulosilytica]|uniref:Uncharacterized protein n=1 Tax=Anaerocolumna cellulosilytica TaxID=433286 RepID=A0A6S6QYW3_9FIRM|nr:hypothetical protein [Anaerocolumna cellulosilytica]BCJ95824.1 hypothetical protein acsn021_33930 [Anaerocolumna cellulosilytica]